MSSSEGKASPPPLRKRKSKRFDRDSGGRSVAEGDDRDQQPIEAAQAVATVEPDVAASPPIDAPAAEKVAVDRRSPVEAEQVAGEDQVKAPATPSTIRTAPQAPSATGVIGDSLRTKTLDERSSCGRCGHEVSMVNIEVDGNTLVMESCDNCDARRWHLAGEPIDLQQALDQVGEHAGRRR